MDSFFSMLFNLLITPPGNYLYYVVLAVFVAATLQATYMTRRGPLDEGRTRVMIGMFLILLVQILFLASSFLGWAGYADPRQFLPPVERAAALLMITIAFWVWAFPDRSRLGDIAVGLTGAVIIFFLVGNLFNSLSLPPDLPFNASLWDWVWQVLTIIMAVIAIMTLNNRRPQMWQTGVAFFAIILVGYVINLASLTNAGDFSGINRLALLIAFLLTPTLAQRFQITEAELYPPEPEPVPEKTTSKRDFQELAAWLELNGYPDIDTFFPALVRQACLSMRADRAFIVVPSDTRGTINFQVGYNYESGEYLPISSASDAILPALTRAAFFNHSQFLDHKENHEELNLLAVTAQIASLGSGLFVPFAPQQKKWGGVLVLKAATRKAWNAEDEERLTTLVRAASQVLDKVVELGLHAQSLKKMASALETAAQENQSLKEELKKLNEQSGYERAEPELNALLAVQQESQDLIASLQRENRRLQKELEDLRAAMDAGPESPYHPARLAADLDAARQRVADLEQSLEQTHRAASQARVVEALLEELKDPAAELSARVDAILSNPADQDADGLEQAIEGLRAPLAAVRGQLKDLEESQVFEAGVTGLELEETDLNQVVDEILTATRADMSRKALNLRLDLPDELPHLYSYHGAVKQILVQVLENAIEASAIGADVELRLQPAEGGQGRAPSLLFQITDWGGGSDVEEARRLFNLPPDQRPDTADEAGGGLFLANRLAEANGGRMWIESGEDGASTINIQLPREARDNHSAQAGE